MKTDFLNSQTKANLMKAFAGESQARNRYTFAKLSALEQNMYVLSEVFRFTAEQEEQHAKIFYELMQEASGGEINITADYPVEVQTAFRSFLIHLQIMKMLKQRASIRSLLKLQSRRALQRLHQSLSLSLKSRESTERDLNISELC